MTMAMEFALPALAGAGVDRLWRFRPIGVLIGAGLGFLAGMFHLLTLARTDTTKTKTRDGDPPRRP